MIIVGHSLGGSLSYITAFDLYKAGYTIDAVVSFGAPPTFKKTMADDYNHYLGNVTFRFVNNLDIIPSLLTKILQFKHVGRTVYFQGENCLPTADSLFRKGIFNFKNHAMDDYLRCFHRQY